MARAAQRLRIVNMGIFIMWITCRYLGEQAGGDGGKSVAGG